MNVEWRQVAADPPTKPNNLSCESACRLPESTPTITIYYCYSPKGWYSLYHPMQHRRLSRPGWLVTYRDGLPTCRWSPFLVLTGSDEAQLCWSRPMRYHYAKPPFVSLVHVTRVWCWSPSWLDANDDDHDKCFVIKYTLEEYCTANKLIRLLFDYGINITDNCEQQVPATHSYNSWQHWQRDDGRAQLTTAVVWLQFEQEAALIDAHCTDFMF